MAETLRWSAHEHEHIERGSDWYWALGVIAVCIAIASIIFQNMLFGILVLAAAGVLSLLANVVPEPVEFEISERGIRVGGVLHRYEEIIAFWVEDEAGPPTLLIDTVKFMSPNLIIPIEGVEPGTVRTLLAERIPEVPMKEPFTHKLFEFFGGGGGSALPAANTSMSCATQPQNPHGTGTDGRPCQQPPQQPSASQCSSGSWKPVSGTGNGCVTSYQCVPNGSGGAPTAQLSCQPKLADVGMQIGFSFSCGNSTGSAGGGFDTGGALSGTASSTLQQPPAGATIATYTLTCINGSQTTSARCEVEIGKPTIVIVATPKKVHSGEISTIGWITSGMNSCIISSPDQADLTSRNANNTSVNGAATTSPITAANTVFELKCETTGGDQKSASTTIQLL